MRIAVTTPTGNVGRHVVPMLLRAGIRPTVLVHDPARLDPAVRDRVDPIVVDQTDAAAVIAATRDVDALYWVAPPTSGDDPVGHYAKLGANAAEAVVANGIPHVVFQSSIGAEKRHGVGEIDGLAIAEAALDGTGASVVHLRCGYFFTNLLAMLDSIRAGVVPIILPPDQPMAWVAPRDVAEVAVLRLLSPDRPGPVRPAVHGPADLSWAEAMAIVSEATGHRVRAERIEDEAMRAILAGAGLGPGQIEGILGMSTGMRAGFVPEQPRDVTTTTPTTLASWAYDELRRALG